MSDSDLVKLYSGRILALAADIPHLGRLDAPELLAARDQLAAMLKDAGPVPAAPFDGFEVLTPARDYRNRHASILLSIEAACEAVAAAAKAA